MDKISTFCILCVSQAIHYLFICYLVVPSSSIAKASLESFFIYIILIICLPLRIIIISYVRSVFDFHFIRSVVVSSFVYLALVCDKVQILLSQIKAN